MAKGGAKELDVSFFSRESCLINTKNQSTLALHGWSFSFSEFLTLEPQLFSFHQRLRKLCFTWLITSVYF